MSDLVTPTARLLAPSGLDRDEWLAIRKQGIGGSDVAAILGMDRDRGPLHVYLSKRGELDERRDPRRERAARRGQRLEGLVAELFAEETGRVVLDPPGTLQHEQHPWMIANLDRITFADHAWRDPAVLECKSRTWRSARREDWSGEAPPDGPALQAHWYMAVTGYEVAFVAGLIDDDLVWFRLERDEELIAHLVQITGRFWHDHVLAGVEPDPGDLESTGELLSHLWDVQPDAIRLVTDPAEITEIDSLLARRESAKTQIAELQREVTGIENTLRAKLGPAEVALAPGRELFSCRQNGNFAPKRFRDAEPELAAAYTHLAETIDRERLAADHPHIYRRFRARVFRTPGRTS